MVMVMVMIVMIVIVHLANSSRWSQSMGPFSTKTEFPICALGLVMVIRESRGAVAGMEMEMAIAMGMGMGMDMDMVVAVIGLYLVQT